MLEIALFSALGVGGMAIAVATLVSVRRTVRETRSRIRTLRRLDQIRHMR
jgi:hypothetical protein